MKCFWQGDLRKVWDTVQLCCIIGNLHYWIVRYFRPWVSSCLDRWRLVTDKHGSDIEDEKDETSVDGHEELKLDGSSEDGETSIDEDFDFDFEVDSGSESESESESELGLATSTGPDGSFP